MSEKLLQNPKAVMNVIRRIALEAGEIALDHFDETGYVGAMTKQDGSPVTEADRETESHIRKALAGLFPSVPMIGEEGVSAGDIPDLTQSDYFWVVDPIDGTKQFIAGEDAFTVNIALIHKERAVSGIVYAPARGELFAGYLDGDGQGETIRWLEETGTEKPIRAGAPSSKGLTVLVGRIPKPGGMTDQFLNRFKINKISVQPSTLRFCRIAAGKADLYPCLGPCAYWDSAAAQVVLEGAGGRVTDLSGAPLTYDPGRADFKNPSFVAANFDWRTDGDA